MAPGREAGVVIWIVYAFGIGKGRDRCGIDAAR